MTISLTFERQQGMPCWYAYADGRLVGKLRQIGAGDFFTWFPVPPKRRPPGIIPPGPVALARPLAEAQRYVAARTRGIAP